MRLAANQINLLREWVSKAERCWVVIMAEWAGPAGKQKRTVCHDGSKKRHAT